VNAAPDATPRPEHQPVTQPRLDALLSSLSLAERVRLLTGETGWTLYALPSIGLRALTVSDGPVGVRGKGRGAVTSAQMPAPSALGATWDERLADELGTLMAAEARTKGADAVLAPVVNIQRTPVAGRHFECFSEDPLLSGRMAVPYVTALQRAGVGACVKHFVANDSETERTVYRSRISPRVLREVYLAPFERVVRQAGVWMVMAAYNGLDDGSESAPATEHHGLLKGVLKGDWGFDGVVVSDWMAATSTTASALGGLDLVMPGPSGPWGEALLKAVEEGEVPEEVIDDKVRRVLRLAARTGALSTGRQGPDTEGAGPADTPVPETDSGHQSATRELLRRAAATATVVLRNEDGLLPLVPEGPAAPAAIALIGTNALNPFVQGGGSAHVTPPHLSRPLDALREAYPGAHVSVHRGGATLRHAPLLDAAALARPSDGITVTVLDAEGRTLQTRTEAAPWTGSVRDLPEGAARVRAEAALRLAAPGEHRLEVAPVGSHRTLIGEELVSESREEVGADVVLDSSFSSPRGHERRVHVGERPVELAVSVTAQVVDAGSFGRFAGIELRHRLPGPDTDGEIAEAARAAAAADVAVVVVGTNSESESEGWDRPDLQLPGRQDELVRQVAAANPRTVVVINAGAPLLLPWLDDVPAVLWWWLPGQEAGGSLADVLTGAREPAGRLPWTLPASASDVPVPDGLPVEGVIDYAEGLDVGYRGWERLGRTPAREFGYGLGYGRWSYGPPSAGDWTPGETLEVTVPVRNDGARGSREVVQLYLEAPPGGPQRPRRWLAGFAVVEAGPGEEVPARVTVEPRVLEVWDEPTRSWWTPRGEYRLLVGRSSRDVRATATLRVRTGGTVSVPMGPAAPGEPSAPAGQAGPAGPA
jgi:beta-glucosidase